MSTTITNGKRTLALDSTSSDSYSGRSNWSADATEREVVSDHRTKEPREFSVAGIVNQHTISGDAAPNRLADIIETIEALDDDGELCTIENGLWFRTGFGLVDFTVSRSDPAHTDAPRVVLNFRKIQRVRVRATRIPSDRARSDLTDQATAGTDGGTGATTQADGGAVQAEAQASILSSGFDYLTGR
jgi:hypothetical protein